VGKLKATAKAAEKAVDKVAELIRLGYPESTAKKIASGELPMDQTSRMARADEMFPAAGYHGTDSDISAFDLNRGGHATGANSAKQGVWIANDSRVADSYANYAASDAKISRIVDQAYQAEKRGDYDEYQRLIIEAEDKEQAWQYGGADARNLGQNTMPLRMRGNFLEYDAGGEAYFALEDEVNDVIANARKQGYDGVTFKNLDDSAGWSDMPADHTVVFDPSNIRSTNAAFDPDQKDSSNLLAGLGAAGVGLGLMQSEDADAVPIVKAGRRMIEAFHGSPHRFDRFSMENIGTGEGAQAYGHGLYFADEEGVAKQYRDMSQFSHENDVNWVVSELKNKYGADVDTVTPWEVAEELDGWPTLEFIKRDESMLEDVTQIVRGQNADGTVTESALSAYRRLQDKLPKADPGSLYRVHLDVDPDTLLDWDSPIRESGVLERIVDSAFFKSGSDGVVSDPEAVGYLAERLTGDPLALRLLDAPSKRKVADSMVSIANDREVFNSVVQSIPVDVMDVLRSKQLSPDVLLHDKSMLVDLFTSDSGSPVAIGGDVSLPLVRVMAIEAAKSPNADTRRAASDLLSAVGTKSYGHVLGSEMYRDYSTRLGQQKASSVFKEAGIPGIRYLDGNSRGAGKGSYNYVMFDDKPISIQERGNVDPTLLAATGGTSAIGLAASQFLQNRQQKQSQWESLRSDLLNTVTSVDRAIGKGFEALEMPWRGLLGLNRTVAGLLYGEGAQAVQEGARVAQQPVEQTAYDMGGVATDASGSPAVGAAVNTMVNLGGPI
jgi:hypothetical protein